MNFPAYVPAAVRNHIFLLLPLLTAIVDAPETILSITSVYAKKYDAQMPFLSEHLEDITDKPYRPELRLHKEILIRIGWDERMREAYTFLANQFSEDESWHQLVWAATNAWQDFPACQIELANATALCRQIEAASEHLALLLEQFHKNGVSVPAFHLSALLKKVCVTEVPNRQMPEAIYETVLFPHTSELLRALAEAARSTGTEIEHRVHDATDESGWGIFPFERYSLTNALLMSGLKTRQRNLKTDYLRAFGCGLTIEDPDVLTPMVQKAMAVVATVVINDPDIVVTYDDVRALFAKGKQRAKRKSRTKSDVTFATSRKSARSKGE